MPLALGESSSPSSTPRESVAATPLVAVEIHPAGPRAPMAPALEQVEDTSLQRRVAW